MSSLITLSTWVASGGWHQYGRWDLLALSLVFHVAVLGLFIAGAVLPRHRVVNVPNGALLAFLVALFAEMYGLPLTVYLLQPLVPLGDLFYPVPLAVRLLGSAFMLAGFLLVFAGWRLIYRAPGRVVGYGIYAHIRHPQYVGLIVLTLGQLIEWPTITGLLLWPLVVLLYVRLSRKEDAEVVARCGQPAVDYQARVPAFIPRLSRSREATKDVGSPRAAQDGHTRRGQSAVTRSDRWPARSTKPLKANSGRRSSVSASAALPWEMKAVGAVVLLVVSFFASALSVLLVFQVLHVDASRGHRWLGLALIAGLGVLLFSVAVLVLTRYGERLLGSMSGHLAGVSSRVATALPATGPRSTDAVQRAQPVRRAERGRCEQAARRTQRPGRGGGAGSQRAVDAHGDDRRLSTDDVPKAHVSKDSLSA